MILEFSKETGLAELAQATEAEARGAAQVRSLCVSNREATDGALFVAVDGSQRDGHEFVDDAFSRGAAAAVVSKPEVLAGRPGLVVKNTRAALSRLCLIASDKAAHKTRNIGITGTNGKTSIHWLLYQALWKLGHPALRVGTLGLKAEGLVDINEGLTTPGPVALHSAFKKFVAGGGKYCVMETSSHALEQRRVDDVPFDVGVFTNLTRDHLDYHGDMDSYFRAKLRLFELLSKNPEGLKAAVVNTGDEWGRRIVASLPALGLQCLTYGDDIECSARILSFEQDLRGSTLMLDLAGMKLKLQSYFLGHYNAANLAAVFAALYALGLDCKWAAELLPELPQVPGRIQSIMGAPFGVYIDYAHTPDGLQNVLQTLRPLTKNRLWILFGCGGERDRGKRPLMAEVACGLADCVVLTADNPRSEDPQQIIDDMLSTGVRPAHIELDRKKAIAHVISSARPGDVVLLAGKGHEDYQILGSEKQHFSDFEEAAFCVRQLVS